MAPLPPLPKIEGDVELLLDVFTHASLRVPDAPLNNDYGNTERLAVLGRYVLQTIVATHCFHAKTPCLPAEQLDAKIKEYLSDQSVDAWMNAYGLKNKLRIAPSEMDAVNNNKEMRKMFETYVGAVYFRNRNGMREMQEWISRLIDPEGATLALKDMADQSSYQRERPQASALPPPPPPPPTHHSYPQYSGPPPPKGPPPSMPPPPPGPSFGFGNTHFGMPQAPTSSHLLSMVSVALLNQKATQNGLQVTYPAEHSGPPHAPTWVVRCCLNGKEYGRGSGKSQKIAKDEAARMAWHAMGW